MERRREAKNPAHMEEPSDEGCRLVIRKVDGRCGNNAESREKCADGRKRIKVLRVPCKFTLANFQELLLSVSFKILSLRAEHGGLTCRLQVNLPHVIEREERQDFLSKIVFPTKHKFDGFGS